MASSHKYDVTEEDGFVLLNRTSSPEVFAEGISQVMIGVPLTKIVLHSIVEPKDGANKEIRRTVQTLSIPTIAAVELANIVMSLCKQSEGELIQMAGDEFGKKLSALLSSTTTGASRVKKVNR